MYVEKNMNGSRDVKIEFIYSIKKGHKLKNLYFKWKRNASERCRKIKALYMLRSVLNLAKIIIGSREHHISNELKRLDNKGKCSK